MNDALRAVPAKSRSASCGDLPFSLTQYSQRVLYQSTSLSSISRRPFHFGSARSSQVRGCSPWCTSFVFQLMTNLLKRSAVQPS